jgi:predicted deacetylase
MLLQACLPQQQEPNAQVRVFRSLNHLPFQCTPPHLATNNLLAALSALRQQQLAASQLFIPSSTAAAAALNNNNNSAATTLQQLAQLNANGTKFDDILRKAIVELRQNPAAATWAMPRQA